MTLKGLKMSKKFTAWFMNDPLVTGAAAKIFFDLLVCTCSLLVHYGVGLPQKPEAELPENTTNYRKKLRRKRRRRHK